MFTMEENQPGSIALQPTLNRRLERAMRAKDTKNRVIPEMLRMCPRAKQGIAQTELIVDPSPVQMSSQNINPFDSILRPDLKIRVRHCDTLTAASWISEKNASSSRRKSSQDKPNVAVLNMASALRPGGGFLEGANSQEEFLCARTSLYPSLWDSYYKLPEVSGIYTPDVLVFRDNQPEANDLPREARFFIDVISSSMTRFSDARAEGCTCGVSYCDRHRDLVLKKMKSVLRIAQSKGVKRLILGAWGCGGYGNPVKEIAKSWRKVIAGAPRQRRPNAEQWDGIDEIIFAIPDRTMYREFESAFSDVLALPTPAPSSVAPSDSEAAEEVAQELARTSDLYMRMAEIEMQMEQVNNPRWKNSLRQQRAALQKEITQGSRAKASKDEDMSEDEEEDAEAEDYVMSGFLASDGEADPFYTVNDFDSDSSAPAASESFEFKPPPPGMDSQTSHDELSEDESEVLRPVVSNSPNFDPETGWFTGSMDGLSALLNANGGLRSCSRNSPGSPDVVRPDSSGLPIDAGALQSYLSKHGGTDIHDY